MAAELMLQVEEQAEVFMCSHILQSHDLPCNLCGQILPCWKSSMSSTNVPCTAAAVLSSKVQTTAYDTTDKLAAACNTVCLLYDKLSSVLSRSEALQQYMAQPERRRRSRQRRRAGRREGGDREEQQQKLTLVARRVCTCSPCLRWDTARTIHTASSPLPPGRTCI